MAMSDIKDKMSEIQNSIKKMMKDRRYKKANKFMEWQNAYSFEINKCAGELWQCKESLALMITEVVQLIRNGRAEVRDVQLQEMELENSVIAYLDVDDAYFALKSVNSYDAINGAFDLINIANRRLYGEKPKYNMGTLFRRPERDDFKTALESDDIQAKRAEIYREIKDDVIENGDIEQCLKKYRINKQKSIKNKSDSRRVETVENETPSVSYSLQSSFDDDEKSRREKIEMDKSISFKSAPPKI